MPEHVSKLRCSCCLNSLSATASAKDTNMPNEQNTTARGFPKHGTFEGTFAQNNRSLNCGWKKPDAAPDTADQYFWLKCTHNLIDSEIPLSSCCESFSCQGDLKAPYGASKYDKGSQFSNHENGDLTRDSCLCQCAKDPIGTLSLSETPGSGHSEFND